MSEHLIEDLVADTVLLLDAHAPAGDPRPRDWFAALYRFQDGFDCSFTRFRVMDALLGRRHTYRFDLDRHPDHAERPAYFAGLREFTALRGPGGSPEDDGAWLEDGYVDPPHLYCDAGSALWRRMAAELDPADRVPPARVSPLDVLRVVAVAAVERGDLPLLADWYNLGPGLLGVLDPEGDARAEEVREAVRRTGALETVEPHGYRPPDDLIAEDPVAAWWWHCTP